MQMKVDFIGDVHGHAVELALLLIKLGYNNSKGYFSHPDGREVVFVGDFIDRGLQIKETLDIVKGMCDNGTAKAVMGNHEYNAILFHTKNKKVGGYYRKHGFTEINQHIETLRQFKDYPNEWSDYLEWFKNLPLFIETDFYRVVHAYWCEKHIEFLRNNPIQWNDEWLNRLTNENSEEYLVVEELLKGKEHELIDGHYFYDADNVKRNKCRIKWWYQTEGILTHGEYLIYCPDSLKEIEFIDEINDIPQDKPIFFGHYWLKEDELKLSNSNAICLDYSVAKKGFLVAYSLDTKKFTIQKSIS
jgi:hypothetical protein